MPHCTGLQGIAITGSKHDAFAGDPWIVRLRECMQKQAAQGKKLLGLCFGAQLLAVALGGRAGEVMSIYVMSRGYH